MPLRENRHLRGLARRLPGVRAYEARIAELTRELAAATTGTGAGAGTSPAPSSGSGTSEVEGVPIWVPPGHFYSPYPSPASIRAHHDDLFGLDPTHVPGVDLHLDAQRALLDALEPLAQGIEWPRTKDEAQAAGLRYWAENPAYGDGDALFLRSLLLHLRPKRLLELGGGYSSAVTLDTRDLLGDDGFSVTFLDPYPELLLSVMRPGDRDTVELLDFGTESLDLAVLDQLESGDVLFIDSTHVSKPGGDVNRIFFHILPRLRPGVVVHLHDIFPAFEYPQSWIEELRGWTEIYVLRAFLQFNDAFEILLWPGFLRALDPADVERRFPAMAKNAGGAIWLRKVR